MTLSIKKYKKLAICNNKTTSKLYSYSNEIEIFVSVPYSSHWILLQSKVKFTMATANSGESVFGVTGLRFFLVKDPVISKVP